MRYARTVTEGSEIRLLDVVEIPSPLPNWAEDITAFLAKMYGDATGFVQVADDNISGAVQQQDGTFLNPASPTALPKLLSKTAFRKYAASQFAGGGSNGMARFEEIMAAAEAATGVVKFCYGQYEAADDFEYSEVETFAGILVTATIMTPDENAAVLGNWPVG